VAAAFQPPLPAPAMAPALESDFARDHYAFGAALQAVDDTASSAAGSVPLPHHINTCVLVRPVKTGRNSSTKPHGICLVDCSMGSAVYFQAPVMHFKYT
jgi:hypothetical protein